MNTNAKSLLLLLAIATIVSQTTAQTNSDKLPITLTFAQYTAINGLSNSHVNAIGQDSKGFVWIATNDGLNRTDGYTMESFHHVVGDSSSINSSTIYDIFTDRENRTWFGTFTGLCRYDYSSECFINYELPPQSNSTKSSPIRDIAQTPDGDIWIATSGSGLARMNPSTGDVKYIKHNDANPDASLCSDYLLSLNVDNNGCLWIGSESSGITVYNPNNNTFQHFNTKNNKLPNDVILTIFKSDDGRIWIGTYENGVTIYNPQNDAFETLPIVNTSSIYSIVEDNDGIIWIGSQENGLYMYSNGTIYNYSNAKGNAEGLINDNIHAVFSDANNNLWLGVFQGGVNMVKHQLPFMCMPHKLYKDDISRKPILSVYPDNNGIVYLGTDGDGLILWNTANNYAEVKQACESGLKSNTIRSIYKDHNGIIWAGLYLKGLQGYDPITQKKFNYEHIPNNPTSLSNNDVTCIIEDRLGNMWIGTNGGGLNLFDKKTGTFRTYCHDANNPSQSIIDDHITSLYIDQHGYLWISTFWGLSRMDPVKGTVWNVPISENDNTYYCTLEDHKHRLWAGTTNGLKLIANDGSFQSITTADGLPSDVINGIAEDKEGNLWMSTNNGICKYNHDTKTIDIYSIEDGLISNEYIHNAMATASDGEIFFGSVDGVIKFYPEDIISKNVPPRLMFSDLLVFNKKVKPGDPRNIISASLMESDEIRLDWKNNSFTISYKAIDFLQPHKIKYACRLTGFDNEWTYHDFNHNSSTYTNLDAGTYHFEVKASTDGKNWSKTIVKRIIIITPLGKRWWAIMLYILAASSAIYILWRYYRRTENEKQKIKIQYIKQQNDAELNKTRLQFFTNISHEFRTPLTLIISPLEQLMESSKFDKETHTSFNLIHRNAQRLLKLVNQIMDLRKIDNNKFQFQPTYGNLVSFMKEIYENFQQLATNCGTSFTFKTDLQEYYAYFDHEMLDKALYNLLSNAFKFTPDNGKIELSLHRADRNTPNNVVIIVEDNGKGIAPENIDKIFDRFFQGDNSTLQQGTGIGLWLTKEFIEMHHGIISVSSVLGKGTAFTIMLTNGEEFKDEAKPMDVYQHIAPEYDNNILYKPSENSTSTLSGSPNNTNTKYSILIVEDNADIRNYLQQTLSPQYEILTASNGTDGLNISRQKLPDLVITDIMMPGIDGIELCRTLKTDIETCHIPIIMLTAKSTEEQRIEGLETGADSYIPKPFNIRHLWVRIEKLLELRKTLREKFGNEIGFEAYQTGVTTPDRDLLKKVTSVIQKRISDSALSVETLAEDVGISRGHLQRKLKSLTGQNPNEFIRIIRLKQAAEILADKQNITISEVADMVGFSSQSYFSTAFTKQFNISPSQYKEELEKN